MNEQSKTPRTDGLMSHMRGCDFSSLASFARTLELENQELRQKHLTLSELFQDLQTKYKKLTQAEIDRLQREQNTK